MATQYDFQTIKSAVIKNSVFEYCFVVLSNEDNINKEGIERLFSAYFIQFTHCRHFSDVLFMHHVVAGICGVTLR